MQSYLQIQDRKAQRSFLPREFELNTWEDLQPYYDQLLAEEPAGQAELEAWLKRRSELESVVSEAIAWRHIRMTRFTNDEAHREAYQYIIQHVVPHLSAYSDKLNRKAAAHPAFEALPDDPYLTYVRRIKREIELYREANIPLQTEARTVSQQFSTITGAMTIEHEGQEITLQKAGALLESNDRDLRQQVWEKVQARRLQDQEKLEEIYDKLVDLRHQMAQNADYDSYTAYKFDAMGRFDYQLADTHAFHQAVEQEVRPLYEKLMQERKERLGVDNLRPWDLSVDIFGDEPLHPFDEAPQLLDRSAQALAQLRPELGEMLRIMDRLDYLDLESRTGKAPGGYNYPLMETGVPFIFMNAVGTHTDVVTMLHEAGHAVHSFLTRDLPLTDLKQPPSEVAELASMSMELLCLDHYDQFYPDAHALKRAQKTQLLRCITIFPWIATIDAFQQWAYDHPGHSRSERTQAWRDLYYRFHGHAVDWTGYEAERDALWIKQGHVYDVPFYYIEYAIAQLGALAVWRNYQQNPQQGLHHYLEALKLGYTRPIPEIYQQAGIRFDLSSDYVRSCVQYCMKAYQDIPVN